MSSSKIASLKALHSESFGHLRMTEGDFVRVAELPPVESRPGAVSIEIKVRHSNATAQWKPLNLPMGNQVLVDPYHPDGIKWDKSHTTAGEA